MPHRPGASPRQGRGRTGGSHGVVRCLVLCGLALLAGAAQAQTHVGRRIVVPDSTSIFVVPDLDPEAVENRDSLMAEIRRYRGMVDSMRDSLAGRNIEISLSDEQKEMLRENIDEALKAVERIADQVSELEFQIEGNRISLINDAGEGIVINIPENLDEQLSQGFHVLSEMILKDLPDSVDLESTHRWNWSNFIPEAPAPPRKTIQGNIVKVGDDLHILAKEEIKGNVLIALGNAEISGKVDGTVVALFGNLLLDDSSEVTGRIVSIGGSLDQQPGASAHDLVSVDLWRGPSGDGLFGTWGSGPAGFLMRQGTFLLTVLLAVLAIMVTPRDRLAAITGSLRASPAPALGLGVVGATLGSVAALLLIAVLVLTVIGVPLALLVFLVLLVGVVLAVGVCGATVGVRLCDLLGQECHAPWLAALVGMTALHLVSFLGGVAGLTGSLGVLASGLSALGALIKVLAFFLGLGAILASRLGTRAVA